MKAILATAAILGMTVPPVLAQPYYERSVGPYSQPRFAYSADRDYARAISPYGYAPHSAYPGFDVYVDGHYVGSDPDPRVRGMLRRDHASQGDK